MVKPCLGYAQIGPLGGEGLILSFRQATPLFRFHMEFPLPTPLSLVQCQWSISQTFYILSSPVPISIMLHKPFFVIFKMTTVDVSFFSFFSACNWIISSLSRNWVSAAFEDYRTTWSRSFSRAESCQVRSCSVSGKCSSSSKLVVLFVAASIVFILFVLILFS